MTDLSLSVAIMDLVKEARAMPASRERSLVITKLQEAYLWLSEQMSLEEEQPQSTAPPGQAS